MRSEIFSSDGQIVATMTFTVSSIVANTLAEPVIGGHIRASIRVLHVLTPPHTTPGTHHLPHPAPHHPLAVPPHPTPHPHTIPGGWAGWALDCMLLLFYGFNSGCLRLVFYGCCLTASNMLSIESDCQCVRMLTGRSLSRYEP